MGTLGKTTGLAGALFSHVQLRVLRLFLGHPDRAYQISEVIRLASSGRGAVQRELEKLTTAGILTFTNFGSRKSYQANRTSPIFNELYRLILKTVGMVEPIQAALKPYRQKIDLAFVYGSIARGKDTTKSDVDLMIFGKDLSYSEVFSALQKTEKTLMRSINPNLTTAQDWRLKYANKNSFIRNVVREPKLFVIGSENDLKRIEQSR